MKTFIPFKLCLFIAEACLISFASAVDLSNAGRELSTPGKVSLLKVMQSADYCELLGKQHGLSPDEIRILHPAPGVIQTNSVAGTSLGLANAKIDFMKDLSSPNILSKPGKIFLRKAMQSPDYMELLNKQHDLSPKEILTLMPAPGVIRPNAVGDISPGLVRAKIDLMKDLRMSKFRHPGSEWIIEPPTGFNPSDFTVNVRSLGTVPPSVNKLDAPRLRNDYWISLCRPMLPLGKPYDEVKGMFVPATNSDAPGMPASLINAISDGWNNLNALLHAVVRLEPLSQGEYATGIYLGNGMILTADHVYDLMTPETKAVWPGLPGPPRSTINRANSMLDVMDLAIVYADSPPANAVSAKPRIEMAAPGTLNQNQSIAVLSCPQGYGKITGVNFLHLYGDLGIVRASPGIIRKTAVPNSAFVQHDCATMQGSSGGAVVSLPSGHVIGVHVTGDDKEMNHFIPLSASTLFHALLP